MQTHSPGPERARALREDGYRILRADVSSRQREAAMKRKELQQKIEAAFAKSVQGLLDKPEAPSVDVVVKAMKLVIDRVSPDGMFADGLDSYRDREVKAHADPDGTFTIHVELSPVELANYALLLYEAGNAHEQVTEILERETEGKFREVLIEMELSPGRKYWTTKPKMIFVAVELHK